MKCTVHDFGNCHLLKNDLENKQNKEKHKYILISDKNCMLELDFVLYIIIFTNSENTNKRNKMLLIVKAYSRRTDVWPMILHVNDVITCKHGSFCDCGL